MNHHPRVEWWRREFAGESGYRSAAIAPAEAKGPDSAVPFWALMSFTFILLIAPQTFFPALASRRIALLAAAVAMTTYLVDRFIHRQPVVKLSREMWITTCLVGWAILTVPLSYWPGGSVSFLLNMYFKALTIFWLLSNLVNTLTRLRLVAWGLSLMAVPLAASGVNQYLSGNFIAGAVVKRIVGYEAPLTGNPNDLALMLNLILPFSLALLLVHQKPLVRIVLLATIALDVTAVILTFSRSGFLTLATTFVMYLWKLSKRPEHGWAAAVLVVALVCIPLLPSGYLGRLSTITDIESDRTGSAQARWSDTVSAVTFVLDNPIIGAGVGMNTLALNDVRGSLWKAIHNVYIEYAVELGLPGLLLFLSLLIGCIRSATFVQTRSAGAPAFREVFHLALGIQISLIAFAVAALFHPVGYHFYFYYIAGLAIAARAVYGAEAENAPRESGQSGEPEGSVAPYTWSGLGRV